MAEVTRPVSIAGNATLTMDSSMLAMLDVRIAASSTQGLVRAGRLIATDVDWITASSHGLVLEEDIAVGVLNSMYTLMAPLEMTPSMAP